MPDEKATQLTEDTAPTSDDLFVTVNAPGTVPATRKVQGKNVFKALYPTATELTIATDAITVTQNAHKLQPQSGTTDDLSTISGTAAGWTGVLYATDFGTDTITIKHNVGNILCPGGSDITLSYGCVFWYSNGTKVFVSGGGGGSVDLYNYLINGGLDIWQRQGGTETTLASYADDTYMADRWYALTQTASIQCARTTGDTTSGSANAGRLKQNQASAQCMGVAQISESPDSIHLRGKAVRLEGRINCSSSQAIRYAILEWTGTADSVTSDVVLSWTSGTYTANNFFLAASLTVAAVGSITPSANTWTSISLSATISSSCNNLIVLVWTEGTAAQNVTLDFTQMALHEGDYPQIWRPRNLVAELTVCILHYEQIDQLATNQTIGIGQAYSTTQTLGVVAFSAKRTVPTVGLSAPSTFLWLNATGTGIAATAISVASTTRSFVQINGTVASGLVAGNATTLLAASTSAKITISSDL